MATDQAKPFTPRSRARARIPFRMKALPQAGNTGSPTNTFAHGMNVHNK